MVWLVKLMFELTVTSQRVDQFSVARRHARHSADRHHIQVNSPSGTAEPHLNQSQPFASTAFLENDRAVWWDL